MWKLFLITEHTIFTGHCALAPQGNIMLINNVPNTNTMFQFGSHTLLYTEYTPFKSLGSELFFPQRN